MKRLAMLTAWLVLLALILSGCSSVNIEQTLAADGTLPEPAPDGLTASEVDVVPKRHQNLNIYFRSTDGTLLVPVQVPLTVDSTEDTAQAVMQLMLAMLGETGWVNPIPLGTRLLSVEHSNGTVTVDLSIDALNVNTPQDLLWMDVAITNTLCELPDVDCVNLLIGGRKYSLGGLSMGALTAESADVPLLWSRTRTELEYSDIRDSGYTMERTALIYYPAQAGGSFLPVATPMRIVGENASWQLLETLCTLPEGAQGIVPAFEFSPEHEERTVVTEDGRRLLLVQFSETTWGQMDSSGRTGMSCGAAALTLLSFIPELDGIVFFSGDQRVERLTLDGDTIELPEGMLTRDLISGRVGSAVGLCFATPDGEGLTRVVRVLPQRVERYPRMLLSMLVNGPLEGENARSVLPEGITIEDILGISMAEDIMIVNLSANFYRLCQPLDATAERLLVYSLVNTLCGLRDVRAVQFFVAGERAEVLSDSIYIRAPLMANPGIENGN